jgi:hypothetical protein
MTITKIPILHKPVPMKPVEYFWLKISFFSRSFGGLDFIFGQNPRSTVNNWKLVLGIPKDEYGRRIHPSARPTYCSSERTLLYLDSLAHD